jgi:hypothetical protein
MGDKPFDLALTAATRVASSASIWRASAFPSNTSADMRESFSKLLLSVRQCALMAERLRALSLKSAGVGA